jgi:hypothetical protein
MKAAIAKLAETPQTPVFLKETLNKAGFLLSNS